MKDGTVYELHQDPALGTPPGVSYLGCSGVPWWVSPYSGKPRLTKITERTGDKIFISNSSIYHQTTNNLTTRTIWFERDSINNRIKAIRDPNSNSNGVPLVK